jgi:hypothetical protein
LVDLGRRQRQLARIVAIGCHNQESNGVKPGWSMKNDRALIRLAREKSPKVDRIAAKLKKRPASVIRAARRLGIYLPPIALKRPGPKPKRPSKGK